MNTKLFVLCTKDIKHHTKMAFRRGHVYIADMHGNNYSVVCDDDSRDSLPKEYFNRHFKVIFPVMENLK